MTEQEKQDLLTVKEVAEAAGITQQAVYQRLNKSLASFVVEVNGKKYLKKEVLALFDVPEKADARQVEQGFNKVEQGFNKAEQGLIDTLQQTIAVLQAQLETKDQQIATKDQQISELHARLEQALTITSQSHFIAAQAQQQLTDGTTPAAEGSGAEAGETAQPEKKKGFFSWLFGNN